MSPVENRFGEGRGWVRGVGASLRIRPAIMVIIHPWLQGN